MSDTGQPPLSDLLMRVPPGAIISYKEGYGVESVYHHVPVGNLCRRAIDEIARLRADAENGWTARDHWKQRCQAADAVVEAARDVDYAHDNHLARLWDRINNLHDALRAYDAANEGVIET